jgi:photosystem II stability/assembly factor-like uncharacterized protein
MNKKLLVSVFLCFFIFSFGTFAQEVSADIESAPIFSITITQEEDSDIVYLGSRGCIYRLEKDECIKLCPTDLQDLDVSTIITDPTDTKRIYVLVPYSRLVLVSNNTGETWNRILIPETKLWGPQVVILFYFTAIAIDPSNPQNIAVGIEGGTMSSEIDNTNGYIIGSTDSGIKWKVKRMLNPKFLVFDTAPSSMIFTPNMCVVGAPKGIYTLPNKLNKLRFLKKGPKEIKILAVDPTNWKRAFCVTSSNEIHEVFGEEKKTNFICGTRQEIKCLAVDPKSPQTFYLGTNKNILKTVDNGKTLQEIYINSLKEAAVNCIAIDPTDNSLIYAGTNKGLFISKNGGTDWNKYLQPKAITTEEALTNEKIISLAKAGLGDETIASLIQKSQTQFDLSLDALINLRKEGVNSSVIDAMIKSEPKSQPLVEEQDIDLLLKGDQLYKGGYLDEALEYYRKAVRN